MATSQPGAPSMWASTSEGPGRGNELVLQGSRQIQGWEAHLQPANISKIRGLRGKGAQKSQAGGRDPSYRSLLSRLVCGQLGNSESGAP